MTIGFTINRQGIMDKTVVSKENVEKETLIQKIEADIFEKTTIKNRKLTENKVEDIISNYGKIEERESNNY